MGFANYQARNYMRDEMKIGDRVLFYHSNTEQTGVVGIAGVSREAHPDHSAWTPGDAHFDAKSTPDKPVWLMVEIAYAAAFPCLVSLKTMQEDAELAGMLVTKKGMRLSVQPVTEAHFRRVCELGGIE